MKPLNMVEKRDPANYKTRKRRFFALIFASILFPIFGWTEELKLAQSEAEKEDYKEQACKQMSEILNMPKRRALIMSAGNNIRARNIVSFYQCYGLFSIMQDYPSSEEVGSLVKSLYQTEWKHIMSLPLLTSNDLSSVTVAVRLGLYNKDGMHSFMMRKHAIDVASRSLEFYAKSGTAEDIVELGAFCFTTVEALQEWEKKHIPDANLVIQLDKLPSKDNTNEAYFKRGKINAELYKERFFGYPPVTKSDISANRPVGLNMSIPIKMSLMAWDADGRPQPELFSHSAIQYGLDEINKMCN